MFNVKNVNYQNNTTTVDTDFKFLNNCFDYQNRQINENSYRQGVSFFALFTALNLVLILLSEARAFIGFDIKQLTVSLLFEGRKKG